MSSWFPSVTQLHQMNVTTVGRSLLLACRHAPDRLLRRLIVEKLTAASMCWTNMLACNIPTDPWHVLHCNATHLEVYWSVDRSCRSICISTRHTCAGDWIILTKKRNGNVQNFWAKLLEELNPLSPHNKSLSYYLNKLVVGFIFLVQCAATK